MVWNTPLIEAVILKRYKRFLADVIVDGKTVVAHVPNTGSMESCWAPNWACALSRSENPDRKLPYTLELIHNGEAWIGVNTANANKLAGRWIAEGRIPELKGYAKVTPEKKIGQSRVDFFLEGHHTLPDCYVEVKNVTLRRDERARFPDAVSERGQKHLRELLELKRKGFRSAMLFVVQRDDVTLFSPAEDVDPVYARLLAEAHAGGVEVLVYGATPTLTELGFRGAIPWELA